MTDIKSLSERLRELIPIFHPMGEAYERKFVDEAIEALEEFELRFQAAREGWIIVVINHENDGLSVNRALAEKWVDDIIDSEVQRMKGGKK